MILCYIADTGAVTSSWNDYSLFSVHVFDKTISCLQPVDEFNIHLHKHTIRCIRFDLPYFTVYYLFSQKAKIPWIFIRSLKWLESCNENGIFYTFSKSNTHLKWKWNPGSCFSYFPFRFTSLTEFSIYSILAEFNTNASFSLHMQIICCSVMLNFFFLFAIAFTLTISVKWMILLSSVFDCVFSTWFFLLWVS